MLQVRQFGGDHVVVQGDNLRHEVDKALGGKKLSLVLDFLGGAPVGELARSPKGRLDSGLRVSARVPGTIAGILI